MSAHGSRMVSLCASCWPLARGETAMRSPGSAPVARVGWGRRGRWVCAVPCGKRPPLILRCRWAVRADCFDALRGAIERRRSGLLDEPWHPYTGQVVSRRALCVVSRTYARLPARTLVP